MNSRWGAPGDLALYRYSKMNIMLLVIDGLKPFESDDDDDVGVDFTREYVTRCMVYYPDRVCSMLLTDGELHEMWTLFSTNQTSIT